VKIKVWLDSYNGEEGATEVEISGSTDEQEYYCQLDTCAEEYVEKLYSDLEYPKEEEVSIRDESGALWLIAVCVDHVPVFHAATPERKEGVKP